MTLAAALMTVLFTLPQPPRGAAAPPTHEGRPLAAWLQELDSPDEKVQLTAIRAAFLTHSTVYLLAG